jgi:ribosomal protein S18 acetylase RimI-like enzyme
MKYSSHTIMTDLVKKRYNILEILCYINKGIFISMNCVYELLLSLFNVADKKKYVIKPVTNDDINGVVEFLGRIAAENFSPNNSWDTRRYKLVSILNLTVKDHVNLFLIAKWDNEIVGCLVLYKFTDERSDVFVEKLAVLKKYQKQGIGRELMSTAAANSRKYKMRTMSLIVEKHNKYAIRWYKDLGFLYGEEREDGYRYCLLL